jgi:hypothetical protein
MAILENYIDKYPMFESIINTIFIDNKYTKWYYNIIAAAKSRMQVNDMYYEKHHIIPKSLGGDNKKDNLVYLTAKEHYIVHLLLPSMIADKKQIRKMWYAVICMTQMKNLHTEQRYIRSGMSRFYEKSRLELSKNGRAEEHSRKISQSLTGRKCSEETKLKISKSLTGNIRSDETRDKISKKSKGRKHSEETKKKLSIAGIGKHNKVCSEETKEKLRLINLGKKQSSETIQKRILTRQRNKELRNSE